MLEAQSQERTAGRQQTDPVRSPSWTRNSRPHLSHAQPFSTPPTRRRSAWHQRLIEAESGFRHCLRMDGTLFVHLFVGCCILAAGFVLRLTGQQWAIIALAITLVITTETFCQMLRALWAGIGHHLPDEVRNVARIASTAVLLSSIGAGAAILLVFADRLRSS